MDVFICEDNIDHKDILANIITDYITRNTLPINLKASVSTPSEIMNYLEKNPCRQGLYFLDVDLSADINGFELANRIRDIDLGAKIVFVTNHIELTTLTFSYKVEALDFIVKDSFENISSKIIECIKIAHERYKLTVSIPTEVVLIETVNEVLKISVEDILFIETSTFPHKIIYHLKDSSIEVYGKIRDAESLSNDFFRCHQSYVVNVKNIISINRKTKVVKLKNEYKCFVSKRYLSRLLEKYSCS